jgi:hypothetical protein
MSGRAKAAPIINTAVATTADDRSPQRADPSYSNLMRFRDVLSRLLPRRSSRSRSEKTRYDEASRVEERTQSHYRSITESDARGRSTKPDDAGARPVSSEDPP